MGLDEGFDPFPDGGTFALDSPAGTATMTALADERATEKAAAREAARQLSHCRPSSSPLHWRRC